MTSIAAQVYLHVQISNSGAIAFYENAGFHKEALIKNYYRRIEVRKYTSHK
jgi:ribosomal protein S18 acetylase RimI-like enzyme